MYRLAGIPAAPGNAIAEPWRYLPPEPGSGDRIDLDQAGALAATELETLGGRLRAAGRGDEAGILEAQALMATDPELLDDARRRVAAGAPASEAVLGAGEAAAEVLAGLDDALLASRAADVRDVAARVARIVRGEQPPRLERRAIVVAAELPPSVAAELDPALLAGVALERGSPTAHAAILARALGVPAVVGVSGLLAAAAGAVSVAVDGDRGEVLIDPDPGATRQLEAAIAVSSQRAAADAALRDRPLATRDGQRITLAANIGHPEQAPAALEAGAEAVGLLRTEFVFMGRATAPDEAVQARAYESVLRTFAGRSVVIRLLDAGGDKRLPYLSVGDEENPFLGMRAIRLARLQPELLATQLRAILRAGREAEAVPWIMAPMVADLADLALVRELLAAARTELGGGPMSRLGIMVELPSAVTLADQLAADVDFLSIGTNDLTQYLLAADRTNPALADRQDPLHPAVLRSVRQVVQAARPRAVPVAVCGEAAGDPGAAILLVGLGVDELSMDPRSFGSVKRALARVGLAEASALAERACGASSAAEARALVAEVLGELPP